MVCNEGYSSSLIARGLRDLGLHRATDLVGGYQAWMKCHSPSEITSTAPSTTRMALWSSST